VLLRQGADVPHQGMDLLATQAVLERGHHAFPVRNELGQGLVRLLLHGRSVQIRDPRALADDGVASAVWPVTHGTVHRKRLYPGVLLGVPLSAR
jgi:hypothetical protein